MSAGRRRAVTHVSTQSDVWLRWSARVTAGALCYAAGFLMAPAPPSTARSSAANVAHASREPPTAHPSPSSAKRRPIARPFLIRSPESCSGGNPEAEQSYRTQQSVEMLGLLRTKLRLAEVSGFGGKEDIVASLGPYLQGWADAFTRTAPDMLDELAEEVERVMCDESASDTQVMLMAQVLRRVPELGNSAGYECVIKRGPDDAVLSDTLTAWQTSSLPLTPAMEELARTTQDEGVRQALARGEDGTVVPPHPMDEPPPAPEAAEPEFAPSSEESLALALRHAQRTGNVEHQRSIAEALEQLRAQEH